MKERILVEFFTSPVRYIALALAVFVLLAFMAACGSADKITEPLKDATRGTTNDGPADTITFPDGFSNVATKCDHGNRIYVIFKSNSAYGSIAVAPNDPSCSP